MSGLGPQASVDEWTAQLGKRRKDLMLVGFVPFVERLCSCLLTGRPEPRLVEICQGGLVALGRSQGRWQILWVIRPED